MALETLRSFLFVPGDRPELYLKAEQSGADATILDLEDAVSPNAKIRAREALASAPATIPIVVRVNAAGTQWHRDDLEKVCEIKPSAVMLPKSKDAATVSRVVTILGPEIPVVALIECARGVSNARAIATDTGVVRVAFGSIDFCADMGCSHSRDTLLWARGELVLASRLAGIAPPIDGVTTNLIDPEMTFDDALYAKQLGFGGKLCIHPKQVGEVARAFIPNDEEIDWARRVLATGDGVGSIDGEMVDRPVRLRAQTIMSALKAPAAPGLKSRTAEK